MTLQYLWSRYTPVMPKLSLLVLLFVSACAPAAEPPTPTPEPPQDPQILFIGDSYTDTYMGLDRHMEALAASENPPQTVEAMQVTSGSTSLGEHWAGPRAVSTIQQGNWTVVVLQDDLEYYGWDEEPFYEVHRNFHQEIEKMGAETVLYLSWKSEATDPMRVEEMDEAYASIGAELGVKVAPVGPAWRRAIAERPGLDLYGRDRNHANITGTYLALVVLYATIFDESPQALPYQPYDLHGGEARPEYEVWETISDEDMMFLKRIAWETVVDYREGDNE